MKPDFSLVLPTQNQAGIIEAVVKAIVKTLAANKIHYEVILVENGSTDATATVLQKLAAKNKRIRATASPSGYGRAVIHGLNRARGQYVAYRLYSLWQW